MNLYAIIVRLCKHWGYTLLLVLVMVGCALVLNPRFGSNLFLDNAQSYWQSRDLSQSSFNQIITNINSHPFVADFPAISTVSYDYATDFYSKKGRGLDIILEKDSALRLISAINIGDIEVNKLKSVNINNRNWLIGLFDSSTAKAANGYYYEQKDIADKYWVSIFEYN